MPGGVGAVATSFQAAPKIGTAEEAAKAFEALLMKQLMSAMNKSVQKSEMFGSGFEGRLYNDMLSDAIAQQASNRGMGLSGMIGHSLGIEERQPQGGIGAVQNMLRGMDAYREHTASIEPVKLTGDSGPPANTALEQLANNWLGGGASNRWGKDGALLPTDLQAPVETEGKGGLAVFNVLDANGYEGHPKCNLFALEMVRRSGMSVPINARQHGWGFPGATAVTKMASSGKAASWANNLTNQPAGELDRIASSAQPLLLAGAGDGERAGHMAVIDRVHDIQRNEKGEILSIEYSGWEAGTKRASYDRRVWRVEGIDGKGRGNLQQIQVLAPRQSSEVGAFHPIDGAKPGASHEDKTSFRSFAAQELPLTTDVN